MSDSSPISKGTLYLLMFFMLIFGAANTLVMKYMDDSVTIPGKTPEEDVKFNHPYFQGAIMFLGEFLCLGAYFVKTMIFKKKEDEA